MLEDHKIIIPWPCLYETVSTHLSKNRERTLLFESKIKKPEVELFSDEQYKDSALATVFEFSRLRGYTFSLTDSVVREMLKDKKVKVDYLVTFNNRDFYDVCAPRQIPIIAA